MTIMNAINWPEGYLPGTTDNFASNEAVVKGLAAADVWPFLVKAALWPSYYQNSSDVSLRDGEELHDGERFFFKTFGFPINAQVVELSAPAEGRPGRISWHGWSDGEGEEGIDVVHAWLVEDLEGGRVRILTQESQRGGGARKLHETHPNPMINGHQDWIDGLIKAASAARKAR